MGKRSKMWRTTSKRIIISRFITRISRKADGISRITGGISRISCTQNLVRFRRPPGSKLNCVDALYGRSLQGLERIRPTLRIVKRITVYMQTGIRMRIVLPLSSHVVALSIKGITNITSGDTFFNLFTLNYMSS